MSDFTDNIIEVDGMTPDATTYADSNNCPHPPDDQMTEAYCVHYGLIWPRPPEFAEFVPGKKARIVNDTTRRIDELGEKYIDGYKPMSFWVAVGAFALKDDEVSKDKVDLPKIPGAPTLWK